MVRVDAIFAVALAIAVILSQLHGTQILGYSILWCVITSSILIGVSKELSVTRRSIALTFVILFFIVFQIRISGVHQNSYYDVLFFLPALGVVFISPIFSIESRNFFFYLLISGSILVCALNFFHHWVAPVPPLLLSPPYAGTRWVGGFDGPNEFGQSGVALSSICLGLHLSGNMKSRTLLVCLIIFATCIFFSFSRGSYLSFSFVFLIYLAIWAKRRNSWKHFIWMSLVVVASYQFVLLQISNLVDKFTAIRKSATERDDIAQAALEMFLENPVLGSGFGSFAGSSLVHNTTPHSDYLYFLVSGGIVGLSILLFFNLYLIFFTFRAKLYPELLFFISISMGGLTFNNLVRGRISIIFWAVLIYALAYMWASRRHNLICSRKIL